MAAVHMSAVNITAALQVAGLSSIHQSLPVTQLLPQALAALQNLILRMTMMMTLMMMKTMAKIMSLMMMTSMMIAAANVTSWLELSRSYPLLLPPGGFVYGDVADE